MQPWSTALLSMLHPIKIAAVEAFVWIDEPLSAVLVYEALDHSFSSGTVAYDVRRLAEAGVLVERYRDPRRGVQEHFFSLAT